MVSLRDLRLARLIRANGGRYGLRIVWEARRAGISVSLGCALVEQESGFRNVFGHDRGANPNPIQGGEVTKARYLTYRDYLRRGYDAQGVGPVQLTYPGYQRQADALGGCWVVRHNIRVGFGALAALIAAHGERGGVRRYNGSGPAAQRYADSVLSRKRKWHARLT